MSDDGEVRCASCRAYMVLRDGAAWSDDPDDNWCEDCAPAVAAQFRAALKSISFVLDGYYSPHDVAKAKGIADAALKGEFE